MMTANEIREKFLKFFESKGHKRIASDSLVPKDDPTVLFTTAGMQQFKRQFLGQIDGYTRAATCQKCLRTDDLDQVGKTPFHHTFFEMLGNFSFGDYFKKDAIIWAWEFLTKELKIPQEKLWVSVYKEDSEAEEIWFKNVKIPKERLVRLGDKSNFWPSDAKEKGPNGPCGPCSEIFYDYDVNPDCKSVTCDPSCNCGRFSEVWNLVFTQFNRKEGGVLEPLPNKNIDTGMGLERLVAVVQGKKSNYETDLFEPILKAIRDEIESKGIRLDRRDKLVIADHIRAVVFGIVDGVIPSNEGRGYVMRKLIVEMSDLSIRNGVEKPLIYMFVDVVAKTMNQPYSEVQSKVEEIKVIIKRIEEAFIKVRRERMPEFKERAAACKDAQELGEVLFLYRDTHGLTPQIMTVGVNDTGVPTPILNDAMKIFEAKMEEQKNRSRSSSKMTGDVFSNAALNLDVPKTKFSGYENFQSSGKILKLFKDNKEVESVREGDSVKIILDQTSFYAESGGQIGDTGVISKDGAAIRVTDTQKIADVFIHSGSITKGSFKVNDTVQAQIDEDRRRSIMRNHTATHLLQAALRKVLGSHVQQQGSLVAEDRLRFDFTHHQPITKEQILEIESWINSTIMNCDAVDKKEMSLSEAKASGALAFFAEKYGEKVRVVSIDGYSKEFCGGTHLDFTGQIGSFKVISEGSVAQGIRRIEAVTGDTVLKYFNTQREKVEEELRVQSLRVKQLEKEIETLRFETIKNSIESIIKNAQTLGKSKIIFSIFKEVDAGTLRKVSDLLKQKSKSAVVVLGSAYLGSAFILVSVTDDLVQKGMKANEIIQSIAPLIDGTGGGRPDLAQAGSKNVQKIESAISQARQLISQKISSL